MLEINETRQVLKSLNLETVNHLWGQKLVNLFFQLGNDRTFSPVQIFKTLPKVLVRQNKNKINPTKKGKYQIQNNRNNIVLFEKKKKVPERQMCNWQVLSAQFRSGSRRGFLKDTVLDPDLEGVLERLIDNQKT